MVERSEKIPAFYPVTTPKIVHRGKSGNIYRLDGIDSRVRLYEKLVYDVNYSRVVVELGDDIEIAKLLFLSVHSSEILETYRTGKPESLVNSAGIMWQPELYNLVLEEALSCKLGVDKALEQGISLVVAGGGHHAEHDRPLGFSPLNAMAIAALYAQQQHGLRIALVDMDVHYSNGCFSILRGRDNIWCSSIWNKRLEHWSYFESGGNIWHEKVNNAREYLGALQKLFSRLEAFKPGFIVYHLGLDVLETDRMGGIEEFDENFLFEKERQTADFFRMLRSPYVVFLGNSYIDYSSGELEADKQKMLSTQIQKQAIDTHVLYRV